MVIDFLTNDEIEYINKSLAKNEGMSDFEYKELNSKHPYAFMRKDNALILSSMKHYGKHDVEFNQFIMNKFGKKSYQIDFFYELTYNVGDYTIPHKDKYFVLQTTLLLLSDDFIGGELLIDNKDVNFNKLGMYINFSGNKQIHEVKKISKGQRRVLVIMFNKKKENII